jgi:hypothetical protein
VAKNWEAVGSDGISWSAARICWKPPNDRSRNKADRLIDLAVEAGCVDGHILSTFSGG